MRGQSRSWTGFLKVLTGTAAGALGTIYLAVLLIDPYGNVPFSLPIERPIMDINQRFMYPQLARSERFDSIVIGTSTSRLLRPDALNSALGGTFANLAMNSATSYEQYRIADLFLRHTPAARTLIVGLDVVWCQTPASYEQFTFRPFPPWMYDDNPWNDLLYMLNGKALEISTRLIEYHLGRSSPRIGSDGYDRFVPPDDHWNLERARELIYLGRAPNSPPQDPPYVADAAVRAGWSYPPHAFLGDLLTRLPDETTAILLYPPVHVAAQPLPGSAGAAQEDECKRRITALAAAHGAHVVDYRIPSPITTDDTNFWDRAHYRVAVAEQIVADLARILAADIPPDPPFIHIAPASAVAER